MILFHNGQYIEDDDIKISVYSPGFQYGVGFFTTLKYQDGRSCHLEYHCERLYQSCKIYGIKINKIDVKQVIDQLANLNNLEKARVKILIYLDSDEMGKYLIIPQPLQLNKFPRNLFIKESSRNTNELYRHKSLNYFENLYYRKLCTSKGFDDILFFDEKGNALEAISSNIFFMKNNKLYTPESESSILNGIMRRVVLESKEIQTIETKINIQELEQFEFSFLTNSIQGIVPVKSILISKKIIEYDFKNLQALPADLLKK